MKYFAISDIHSHYSIMKKALLEKGFDYKNPDHKIILCGDAFDRGLESIQMFNWLKKMIAKDKLIYIKGNHEYLLQRLLLGKVPSVADFSNGTVATIMQFCPIKSKLARNWKNYNYFYDLYDKYAIEYISCINRGIPEEIMDDDTKNNFYFFRETLNDVVFSNEYKLAVENANEQGLNGFIVNYCKHYFETKKYIFCHGWIPNTNFLYDWRNGDWQDAVWTNGIKEYIINPEIYKDFNKEVIIGHIHCSWYRNLDKNSEEPEDLSIFHYTNGNSGIYAIDAATVISGTVNVLILEDEDVSDEDIIKEKILAEQYSADMKARIDSLLDAPYSLYYDSRCLGFYLTKEEVWKQISDYIKLMKEKSYYYNCNFHSEELIVSVDYGSHQHNFKIKCKDLDAFNKLIK